MRPLTMVVLAVGLSVTGCRPTPAPADVEAGVRAVLAELLNVPAAEIVMDRPIAQPPLKADALDLVEVVMELEERFDIEIPDDAVAKAAGVGPDDLEKAHDILTPEHLVRLVKSARLGRRK